MYLNILLIIYITVFVGSTIMKDDIAYVINATMYP